jgi:type VI secretion system secreted protein VgrG
MARVSRFLEAATPLGEDLALLRMSGREELGRLSEFQLEFVSRRGDIKPQEILGKKLAWSLELADGDVRYFNGYVTRFVEAGEAARSQYEQGGKGQAYFYQATAHPWLWFLTRRSNCRTFQNKTVVEIVEEVFLDYQFATVKKVQLRSDYPKKEFAVQYRETDFNFVCRLLEQEGIYFAFEYGDDGEHACVLMDSYGAHKTTPPLEVPFYPESVAIGDKDCMTAWTVQREIQPGRYVHDDYDWMKPQLKVSGEGLPAIQKPHDLAGYEIYDYPGEYKPGEGEQYAKVRIEELHARYEEFSGRGCVRLCAPGRRLKLQDHPRRAYNEPEYLLTSVSYSGSAGDYASGGAGAEFHCAVTAIDSKATFRPQRLTPKPIVQGPQTAFVVGPAGEEIYTDEYGRIKVQFHWDRYSKTNENSSCWVRVAQPFAGKEWGFTGYPRVGHEVVVYFLEGDPDYPLVCGSLYNGEAKPPYKQPDWKTRTGYKSKTYKGSGYNELYFEDKPGCEEIYLYAQMNKSVYVNNNRYTYVGYDDHLVVKYDAYEKCDGDHHIKLKGDRNEKLDGNLSLDVGQNLDQKVGMKLACDAGMEMHLKAGMTMVLEAGVSLTLKVGGNFININPAGVFVSGTLVMINSGGAAGTGSGASPVPPEEAQAAHGSYGGSSTAPPKKYKPTPYKYKPSAWKPQSRMFQQAAESGTPFCEICNC